VEESLYRGLICYGGKLEMNSAVNKYAVKLEKIASGLSCQTGEKFRQESFESVGVYM